MKGIVSFIIVLLNIHFSFGQNYSTTIDTFYVQTPEYSASLGIDSLYFPCAITKPNIGSNFPVLILVHGTAALDKDGNSTKDYLDFVGASYRKAKTRMFYEIADSLSSNGVIVVRYDKRSYTLNCIEKPACWYVDTISPYDYIKDIGHAIDFAKNIPSADTCNIFLAGHSQGGSFVSLVGSERADIRGVLNMAGTAQPIDSIVFYQEEFINANPLGANILRSQFDSLRNGLWPMTDTLFNNRFSPRFLLDWISHTDSAVIVQKNSDKATALMYGAADRFAPASIHYQIWLDSITRPNVTFQLFNSIDHAFGTEYDSLVSPLVLNFMKDWIFDNVENCAVTGINETGQNLNYSIYPNPVNDIVFIESESKEKSTFQLLDLQGRIVKQGIIKGINIQQIDLRELKKGVYFLNIDSSVLKIIKG